MPTIEKVKKFIRVDENYDDDIVESIIDAADKYLQGAIHPLYSKEDSRAEILILIACDDIYNRGAVDESPTGRTQRMINDFKLQLKLEAAE